MARGQKKRYGMKQYMAHFKKQEKLASKLNALHKKRQDQADRVLSNIFESIEADRGLASRGNHSPIRNANITEMQRGRKYPKKARDNEYLVSKINIRNDPVAAEAIKIAKKIRKKKKHELGEKEKRLLLTANIAIDMIRLRAMTKAQYLKTAKMLLPKAKFMALAEKIEKYN